MTPQIINHPQRIMVGVEAEFISAMAINSNAGVIIPKLWQDYGMIVDSISHKSGLCMGITILEGRVWPQVLYVAAHEVSELKTLPQGAVSHIVPSGNYALFTHKGVLSNLSETMAYIYGTWLPKNNSLLRQAPHLEIYDERFIPDSDKSKFDIGVPIK